MQRLKTLCLAPLIPVLRGCTALLSNWRVPSGVAVLVVALLISLMLALFPLAAQDAAPPCDYAAVSVELLAVGDLLTDAEAPDLMVRDLARYLAEFQAVCAGLSFASEAGDALVLGPVTIPEGIYRATFTTSGYGSVKFTALDGQCGEGQYFTPGVFILTQGQAANGAQKVVHSDGCSALIEVGNVQDGWTLALEQLQ